MEDAVNGLHKALRVVQRMEKFAKYQPSGASPSLVRIWAWELRDALQVEVKSQGGMMRKADKQELARVQYGLSLEQCSEHHLPLVRHEDREFADAFGDESMVDVCWDCPLEGCEHHVHEEAVQEEVQ